MASATDTQAVSVDEPVVEVATTVSPEVKVAAAQAVLSEGGVEVTEVLRDRRGETLALVQRLLASAGIKGTFSLPKVEDDAALNVELADATEERELSPEDAECTLSTLESRFSANSHLHEGCDWSRVKSALEANTEALWSISQMEAQGHMPDVYNFDGSGFDIGTCSEETPAGARNCVYAAEAAAWLKENRPQERFNGSAVEMAKAMGIGLMSPAQYRDVLQSKGKFDMQTWSWLLTDEATREAGVALYGNRYGYDVRVGRYGARSHVDDGAWRGSLRVLWA